MKGMQKFIWKSLISFFCILIVLPGLSADKKNELTQLKKRIEKMEQALASKVGYKQETKASLNQVEKELEKAREKAKKLADEHQYELENSSRLEKQLPRLLSQQSLVEAQLAQILLTYKEDSNSSELKRFLFHRTWELEERYQSYLLALSEAQAVNLEKIQDKLRNKNMLLQKAQANKNYIELIEQRQKEKEESLSGHLASHEKKLKDLDSAIQKQQSDIKIARKEEKKLARLLKELAVKQAKKRKQASSGEKTKNQRKTIKGYFSSLKGKLSMPVQGKITARFGSPRDSGQGPYHGWFIEARPGVSIKAVASGEVIYADWLGTYGNLIILDHEDGFFSIYAHTRRFSVAKGQQVNENQEIAQVGKTGGLKKSGLYFELRLDGTSFDPSPWVKR